MSDKNFKVKNGLTIEGATDTNITADGSGGILVNGAAVGASVATPSAAGTVFGSTVTTYNNTAVGYNSLYGNTTGNSNTAVGYSALRLNTTGFYNTALGFYTLFQNTTGSYNTAVGYKALYGNTTGYYNTFFGIKSWYSKNSFNPKNLV